MKVMCINGSEGILTEGDIYTVREITSKGNFLLDEVEVPEGYSSFQSSRFVPVQDSDDEWTEEMEKQYWAEQPPTEYNA